jgi:hypothetical protein
MSTLTISGTMTFPMFNGGPNASLVIGAPAVNPSSTSGPTLTFDEGGVKTLQIAAGVTQSVPFGTVGDGDFVYIGVDAAATIIFNGGADEFTLAAGGFIIMHLGSITAATIEAGVVDVEVSVVILGAS